MSFNKLDICAAYWLFGSHYHRGQWTKEYSYMSRAQRLGFRPGLLFRYDSLSDNGREIYDTLVARELR